MTSGPRTSTTTATRSLTTGSTCGIAGTIMDYPRTCRFVLYLLILLSTRGGRAIDISQCIAPLGMETGAIPDGNITASSSFESGNVGPHHGRLKHESHGGAWCPKQQITPELKEWLQIDLHTVHMITATGTQGRFGNGQGAEYAETYQLEYWRPRLGRWVRYKDVTGDEVINGNTNTYLESKHELEPPIWASKIRFLPYAVHRRTVCMRVELYGCPWNDGIVSYSMPQGDQRGNWEFFDVTYDGYWDDELRRGLGQLTDGRTGPDDFKMGYYDHGQGWVGWRNDTRNGHPLEVKFEFDHVREFSAVHIFCNNQFTKDVQVFSQVDILFSVGGKWYHGDPIVYSYMEDRIFENPRNISVKLHHRIGKFVKLRFSFASRWLMISEVIFDSDVAHGNFTPEAPPSTEAPRTKDRSSARDTLQQSEIPVSTAKQDDPTYMAVIIGVLTAVILLLAVAIFLIVSRHRQRKNFASPLGAKSAIPSGNHQHLSPESAYGTTEKDPSLMTYRVEEYDDRYAGTKLTTLPRDLNDRLLSDVRLDEYQEPFHENKYREPPHATYYGYSTVVIDNKDLHDNIEQSDATYDYAVPMPVPSVSSDQDSVFSKSSSRGSAKACLQSFFPPPPPPMSAPPARGSSNLTYSSPPSPEPISERERRGSKRREHSLHRYA